jgi:hypothetical protein
MFERGFENFVSCGVREESERKEEKKEEEEERKKIFSTSVRWVACVGVLC